MPRDPLPSPFDAIRRELAAAEHRGDEPVDATEVRLDTGRMARTGIPEVVYAEFKSTDQVIASLQALLKRSGRAIAARCHPESLDAIEKAFITPCQVTVNPLARTAVITKSGATPSDTGGVIGIIAAGTSDAPVAQEAALIAREMGCMVVAVNDVGVAGLHRLVVPLEQIIRRNVAAIVVVAGMDGALPSVVAGLVSVPVIGLPTSVGYGFGGGGEAALGTMLQTCVPGLVVVNIDNGIGAGATAALIANQLAAASTP